MTTYPSDRKRGGQPKISIDRLRLYVQFVGAGLPESAAAAAVGIGDTTRKDWHRRGRREMVRLSDNGIDPIDAMRAGDPGWPTDVDWRNPPDGFDPDEWPFVAFAVSVQKALATFQATHLRNIAQAAAGANGTPRQWQASAWLLERSFPEIYGRPEAKARLALLREAGVVRTDDPAGEVLSADDVEAKFLELEETMRRRRGEETG